MPSITHKQLEFLVPLADQQGEMTQPSRSNACGAYALLAALATFRRLPTERRELRFQLEDGDRRIELTTEFNGLGRFSEMAAQIYRVTGVLNPKRDPDDDGDMVEAGGYNAPSAMAAVARQLCDLNVRVMATAAGYRALSQKYPNEQGRCEEVVGAANVSTTALYAPPERGQVQLLCVNTRDGLHWIARGPDGTYYDPGDGSLDNAWGDPTPEGVLGDFTFSGVWLELSTGR